LPLGGAVVPRSSDAELCENGLIADGLQVPQRALERTAGESHALLVDRLPGPGR